MKVLIVEDEEFLAEILDIELSDAGYSILGPVDTVLDAQTVVQLNRPDVALININLRDGSRGTDLAEQLARESNVICLFVSGKLAEAREYRHFAMGAVTKPYSTKTILEVMKLAERILRGKELRDVPDGLELFHNKGQPRQWSQAAGIDLT